MNCSRKNYKVVESKNLKIGDKILTAEGSLSIRKINAVGHKNCYDISIIRKLDDSFMKEPNFILSNGIVSHNCNLQIVNDAHSLVKKRRGVDIDWDNVDLDDKFVYDNVVHHHDHYGTFQYESSLAKRLMRDILPDNFEDLSAVSSLLRPGPLRMGMHTEFADRKHGRKIEGRDYEIPECIRDIIGYTYGIIVYQEEFMEIAHKIGGLDRAETNAFRKALVKYGKGAEQEAKRYSQVESYHNKFIENACKPEFLGDKLKAEELWDLIASFAAYGFNKSISSDEMVEDKTRGTISLEMVNRLVKFGQKIQVKSTDKNENIIWVDVNDVHDHGILDLVEVELEDGKKIKCTLDHKFRTSEGMIPLHDILERDLEIITEEELCKKQ